MNDKHLWNRLAKENYKYYVYSDRGRNISDEEFELSGKTDYKRFIDSENLNNTQEMIVLEIGCGAGRLLKPMGENFKKVIGIDISEVMIFHAHRMLKSCKNIELYSTDGINIPVDDDSVDFIFSYTVFQHMKDFSIIEKNFKESYRVLKSGGTFKVLLSYVKYKSLKYWWSGVSLTDNFIDNLILQTGYKIIKKNPTNDNRVWLLLEK